jgi:GT2 family glycosyltransferase
MVTIAHSGFLPVPEIPPAGGDSPALSVIVPVLDGERVLPASLAALRASDLPPTQWELIVVDDCSRDRSAELAGHCADQVIRLTDGPRGPATARNRGAEVARGRILAFVDADVCVHRDTLRRFLDTFERDPAVSAVFGAYDLTPIAPGLISQYRNLLHRYVHERDAGAAVTFWAGCGAVRADVFAGCSGFDETVCAEPSVEDIQLGYRMSAMGHRIVLDPEIQGTHLKSWSLRSMIVTDVVGRGIPWVRLLLSGNVRPTATLNLRPSEQVCTLLVVIAGLACALWWASAASIWLMLAAGALGAILVLNAPLLRWFAQQRGWRFAARTVPLRVLYYALNSVSVVLGVLLHGLGRERRFSGAPKVMLPSRGASH